MIALGLLSFGGGVAANAAVPASGDAVVYDATVTPLPGNLPSLGFQATQTAEFGDLVALAGTNRVLRSATVTMSDWAMASTYSSTSPTWTHPITFNVYNVDRTGPAPAPGTIISSVTKNVDVPWRPEADASCPGGTAWRASPTQCYNGLAFNVTFDLSSIGIVPNEIIYGIAYNTNTWGADPLEAPGPYESLNVGLNTATTTIVGDVEPDAVFWNTMTAANYDDDGVTGTFRRDTDWAGFVPAVSLTASAGSCSFSVTGDTITLLANCTTDQTILVPDGMTLNGTTPDGVKHSITAVDPAGGPFSGAVVQNAVGASTASVINLTVTADDLDTACGTALAGIRLDGASGEITNDTVTGIQQGTSGNGCQVGDAIEVVNTSGTGTPSVTVTDNIVTAYQKTGILVTGKVSAVITGNTVTGYGPVGFIAQNGIQVSYGAAARLDDNTISNNFYTPKSYTACGVIIYKAGGLQIDKTNIYSGNEKDVCTYGKGGNFKLG